MGAAKIEWRRNRAAQGIGGRAGAAWHYSLEVWERRISTGDGIALRQGWARTGAVWHYNLEVWERRKLSGDGIALRKG